MNEIEFWVERRKYKVGVWEIGLMIFMFFSLLILSMSSLSFIVAGIFLGIELYIIFALAVYRYIFLIFFPERVYMHPKRYAFYSVLIVFVAVFVLGFYIVFIKDYNKEKKC